MNDDLISRSALRKEIDLCDIETFNDKSTICEQIANAPAAPVLPHLMLLDVEEDYGAFQMPKVILYNENHVTQEEALRIARAGEYHPSVLTLPKRQWESLFLNRKED